MGLVDLRGRQDEPDAAALVSLSHGSQGSAQRAIELYGSGDWTLIGWEENGELTACVGVERSGEELIIRSLAVDVRRRERGIGRALLDALADAATGTNALVAETDADAAGFYAKCGFGVEEAAPRGGSARFRCSRPIETKAVAAVAVAAVTLTEVEAAVRAAWSRETSEDPDDWTDENPAAGHCGVTALVVRDLLGGEILIAGVVRNGRRAERHAWNRLPSGLAIDLTREQFRAGETFEQPVVGEPLVGLRHRERFELFARRVRSSLFGAPDTPN